MNASILTYTGCMFDLLDPDPERIDLRDVAHALARIGRFTGHGDQIFTDAQHSVLVCDLAPAHLKRWALLHDAEEAYVGDVSSPMKEAIREVDPLESERADPRAAWSPYDEIVRRVRTAISVRFGIRVENVSQYDRDAALLEVELNGPHSSAEHAWPLVDRSVRTQCAAASNVWPVELAEFMFLTRCKELGIS
jgi:hypothetical protein